jgi:hypothetical protein
MAGVDAPERLLFTAETDPLSIPGIDERAFGEIARYRARFAEWPLQMRLNGPSAAPERSASLLG